MSTLPYPVLGTPREVDEAPHALIRSNIRHARVAAMVLLIGGGAATLMPIGGAVIGTGSVGVESRVKRVAHPEGGTIAAIYVRNGDHVAKGQPLIRLDDTVSGSDASLAALSVEQLVSQRARLEAEQIDAAAIGFPPDLAGRTDPGAVKAMADERRLFAIRRAEAGRMRAQLAARIAQYRQQIAGYRAQMGAVGQEASLLAPERAGLEQLFDKGLVTLGRRNQTERQAVEYQGNVASLQTQIAQVEAHIGETREQMLQAAQTRRAEAGAQLANVNSMLNQQRQHSIAAGDLRDHSLIRAPNAGIVNKFGFSNIGDVVKPAEPIMDIVPDRERQVVEAQMSPADISQVAVGQPARIRFTAFKGATTSEVEGKVVELAPDRTVDPDTKRSFYAARVSFDRADLARAGVGRVLPGMPAEVFIQTGSRSMLSYLTKPLRDQLARAFRD